MRALRIGAALALTGRDAPMAVQAAAGMRAFARARGADLEIVDHMSEAGEAARAVAALARRCDLLLGPYGSGATRAAAAALDGRPEVLWNHGGAATDPGCARVVDVIGPAHGYWAGLADALARAGADGARTALVHGPTGFGRAVADGALASLAARGRRPLIVVPIGGPDDAEAAVDAARDAGAETIVGAGRMEEEFALAATIAERGLRGALVVCGVAAAAERLGAAVLGWIGPAQWIAGADPEWEACLPRAADYPAAQALAACLVAERALAAAGSADPERLWAAALGLRTRTLLGPFAVDQRGRQIAHAPLIVRWEPGPGGPVRRVLWRPAPPGCGDFGGLPDSHP